MRELYTSFKKSFELFVFNFSLLVVSVLLLFIWKLFSESKRILNEVLYASQILKDDERDTHFST